MKTLATIALAALVLVGSMTARADSAKDSDQPKVAYIASKIREPFHRPTCEWAQKISPDNLKKFKTREEAINAGHRPCKVCKP